LAGGGFEAVDVTGGGLVAFVAVLAGVEVRPVVVFRAGAVFSGVLAGGESLFFEPKIVGTSSLLLAGGFEAEDVSFDGVVSLRSDTVSFFSRVAVRLDVEGGVAAVVSVDSFTGFVFGTVPTIVPTELTITPDSSFLPVTSGILGGRSPFLAGARAIKLPPKRILNEAASSPGGRP